MTSFIYLDHAATTPVAPQVTEAMRPFLGTEGYGNPSSLHRYGKQARRALEDARRTVADCLGASADEILFTAGGTESDNLAVLGVTQTLSQSEATRHKRHIITSCIEHSAVAKPCAYLQSQGWDVTYLPVNSEGFVALDDVKAAVRPETALVSIMHANNEVGTIQPIEAIGTFLREQNIPFHTDAVQTAGKLPISVKTLMVDYLSLSAHKLYGPKGAGALYVRRGAPLPTPLIFGGGQESGYRSGTENVAGCVGLSVALKLLCDDLTEETQRLKTLQRYFIDKTRETIPGAELNGPDNLDFRVPGNVNFSFPPAEGEGLVLQLDLKGVAVSTGSACKSVNIEPSPIVLALGKSDAVAQATVRFSMGHQTRQEDLDKVVDVISNMMARYKTTSSTTA